MPGGDVAGQNNCARGGGENQRGIFSCYYCCLSTSWRGTANGMCA